MPRTSRHILRRWGREDGEVAPAGESGEPGARSGLRLHICGRAERESDMVRCRCDGAHAQYLRIRADPIGSKAGARFGLRHRGGLRSPA